MITEKDLEKCQEEFLDEADRDIEQAYRLACCAVLIGNRHFESYGYSRSGRGGRNAYKYLIPAKPIPPSIDDPEPDAPFQTPSE